MSLKEAQLDRQCNFWIIYNDQEEAKVTSMMKKTKCSWKGRRKDDRRQVVQVRYQLMTCMIYIVKWLRVTYIV